MIAQLTRRAIGLGVSIFATLGFMAVPLGDRTGFQHTKAILLSEEVRRFGQDLASAATQLRQRVLSDLTSAAGPGTRESDHRPTGASTRPKPTEHPESLRH